MHVHSDIKGHCSAFIKYFENTVEPSGDLFRWSKCLTLDEYGRVHSIQLHAFCQGSCSDSEMCPVCFEEVSDSPIILQCDTCKGVVHLKCMEGWLAHR